MGAFESLQQARARLQEERTAKSIAVLERCRGIAAEERNKVRDLEIQLRTELDRKEVLVEQARVLGASTNYVGNCSRLGNHKISILNTSRQIMGPQYNT